MVHITLLFISHLAMILMSETLSQIALGHRKNKKIFKVMFFIVNRDLCVLFSKFLIYTLSIDWIGLTKFFKCNFEQALFPSFDSIILLYIYFEDQNKPPFSSAWCCCSNVHSKGSILSTTPDDQSNILMRKRLLYSNYNSVFQRQFRVQ